MGRWDFDTAEEYGDYMNKKEALPKAAFQYGVKMADGRKTRRIGVKTEKSERAELDREWQKIQSIMHKRKAPSSAPSGAPSAPSDSPSVAPAPPPPFLISISISTSISVEMTYVWYN